MKDKAKKFFKIFTIVLISFLYLAVVFLLFSTITEYKPLKIENIALESKLSNNPMTSDEISIFMWNIGHAGLSKEMDDYTEGGNKQKPGIDIYQKTLNALLNKLSAFSYVDFMLLQEVDVFSNRSYYINQRNIIADFLPDFSNTFALTDDVQFKLFPLYSPLGRLKSGLQTLTKFTPIEIQRRAYPSQANWPTQVFLPRSCFLINRYLLDNGKHFLVINTQYAPIGLGMSGNKDMEALKLFVTNEYNKGNYVIVGGDWNMNPPGFKKMLSFNKAKLSKHNNEILDKLMPSDWKWVYDNDIPSKRKLNAAFNAQSTLTTVTDFFLLSPNIQSLNISCLDMKFEYSAHNPVLITIKLK